jgi:hypothetical protein
MYCCQANAWMDKAVMVAWLDEVLVPYVAMAPDDVVPLLILNSYQCHMLALVVQRIQELRVEVRHIPGGCTSLCQPINVGFNKPSVPSRHYVGRTGSHIYGLSARRCRTLLGYTRQVKHQTGLL